MKRIIFLIIISSFLVSCGNKLENANTNEFPKSDGTTLAFDFSIPPPYDTKLIVKNAQSGKMYRQFLPLSVAESKNSEEILSSVGNYEKYTYVNYIGRGNNNMISIGLKPIIVDFEPADVYNKPPNEGVYFIKNGLQRTFIYNYDYIKNNGNYKQTIDFPCDTLNYIAIKLPLKSEGREIENGKTTIPEPISSKDNIKIFPGNHSGLLQVKYELKEELTKTKWFLLVSKSFILLIVPILDLIFLPFFSSKRTKKLFFYISLAIEFALLITLVILGINGKYIGYDTLIDSATTSLVAILTLVVTYVKAIKPVTDNNPTSILEK